MSNTPSNVIIRSFSYRESEKNILYRQENFIKFVDFLFKKS